MEDTKKTLDCVSVGELTFVFVDGQDNGLATIRFTLTQEAYRGPIKGQRDAPDTPHVSGTLDPKDSDGAYRLLQQALDNKPFSVCGRFKSAYDGDEAEWRLSNVQFDHVAPGRLSDWTFRAQAAKQ